MLAKNRHRIRDQHTRLPIGTCQVLLKNFCKGLIVHICRGGGGPATFVQRSRISNKKIFSQAGKMYWKKTADFVPEVDSLLLLGVINKKKKLKKFSYPYFYSESPKIK